MNELDIIKETLNQLVNWKNLIEANSKSIDLLPPSTNGNKLVAVHNQTSLETEKFDLSAALQWFNQLNDKIKIKKMDEKIEISVKEYAELVDAYRTLLALESAGVDNWDGYDYAMEILETIEY